MSKLQFYLKRSRLAVLFQLVIFAVITGVFYQLFELAACFMLLVLAAVFYLQFLKRPHVVFLAQLDKQEWSIQYNKNSADQNNNSEKDALQRKILLAVFDYDFFVVLKFADMRHFVVIWRDQMTLNQWKKLKIMAKLI